MSKSLIGLLVLLVLAGASLVYTVMMRRVPCVTPMYYSVAALDPKFGLTKDEVEANVKKAAAIWNKAIGKEVLVEGEKSDLPIYFQYGSAQQAADSIESINADIDRLKVEQNKIANEYAQKQKAGVSEHELAPLLAQYYKIKDSIDADIARGRNAPSGEIKEGRFVADKTGERIYIYEFQTNTKLVRILTHEFGHALGLEHVENSDSVMYPLNESPNLTLTAEDRAELARACTQ